MPRGRRFGDRPGMPFAVYFYCCWRESRGPDRGSRLLLGPSLPALSFPKGRRVLHPNIRGPKHRCCFPVKIAKDARKRGVQMITDYKHSGYNFESFRLSGRVSSSWAVRVPGWAERVARWAERVAGWAVPVPNRAGRRNSMFDSSGEGLTVLLVNIPGAPIRLTESLTEISCSPRKCRLT